ncbi:hypothetical protein Tco_0611584 [Tanacetum coccineum]
MEEDKESNEVKEVEEDDEDELKKHLVIKKDEDIAIDAIPLATKLLVIIDYKLYKYGMMVHYQLIRVDESSKRYSLMIGMLQGINREDLEALWRIVKTKYSDIRPEDEFERVLWGDLKVMFELDKRSDVWRILQGYRVTIWKLIDSSGVQFVRFENVHIFMLVEKRYPLIPITITNMLNKKLQTDHQNEMCDQLLKLMIQKMNIKFKGGLLGLKRLHGFLEVTTAQVHNGNYAKAFKRVNTFVDFRTDLVEGSSKRAGDELEQEVTKKQKVDDVQETARVDDDQETTKIKELMKIVSDKEEVAIDAIPLATKLPSIVDCKIHKEGKKNYYQIIRADGSSKMYLVFSHMLKSFDREDFETLWKLVKAKYGSTRPVEDLDLILYGDLKTMFEPHVEDQVWKNQQDYRVLDWKLYDSCGVYSLRMQHMHIHMLVEKRYPLTPATITDMLNKKL